jgi:hypothetical protein
MTAAPPVHARRVFAAAFDRATQTIKITVPMLTMHRIIINRSSRSFAVIWKTSRRVAIHSLQMGIKDAPLMTAKQELAGFGTAGGPNEWGKRAYPRRVIPQ